jgi:hypothetical protein
VSDDVVTILVSEEAMSLAKAFASSFLTSMGDHTAIAVAIDQLIAKHRSAAFAEAVTICYSHVCNHFDEGCADILAEEFRKKAME